MDWAGGSLMCTHMHTYTRRHSAEGSPKKAKGATLFLREVDEGVVTDTRTEVSSTVNGLTFRYTAGSFFQVRKTQERKPGEMPYK